VQSVVTCECLRAYICSRFIDNFKKRLISPPHTLLIEIFVFKYYIFSGTFITLDFKEYSSSFAWTRYKHLAPKNAQPMLILCYYVWPMGLLRVQRIVS